MTVDVNKLKSDFTSKINDMFNEETYFIETCKKFPSKYSLENEVMDLSLRIFFEENNMIDLCGKTLKYCMVEGTKRRIKLVNISDEVNSPDVNIVNNYIIEDNWKQIDW